MSGVSPNSRVGTHLEVQWPSRSRGFNQTLCTIQPTLYLYKIEQVPNKFMNMILDRKERDKRDVFSIVTLSSRHELTSLMFLVLCY